MSKLEIEQHGMIPKFYPLLMRCVEDGIDRGFTRAHKYTDEPGSDLIKDNMCNEIMTEISKWFDLPQQNEN